jgi:hypothetical protein
MTGTTPPAVVRPAGDAWAGATGGRHYLAGNRRDDPARRSWWARITDERRHPMNSDSRLLRFALRLDAAACAGLGVASLALNSPLDRLFGTPPALTVSTGAFLVLYAAGLWLLATRPRIHPAAVWIVILGNLGWVAASVAITVAETFPLTGLGVAFVLAQAVAVVALADLEYLGLRKIRTRAA